MTPALPPPPVTIHDPAAPNRPRDLPVRPPRRRWTAGQRALATASALLALSGVAVARDLRARDQRSAAVSDLRVRAVIGGLELRPDAVRARLLLLPDSPVALSLEQVELDSGWRPLDALPSPVLPGAGRTLVLTHPLDCSRRLQLPRGVRLTVAARGVASRALRVDVESTDDDPGPSPLDLACGTLPPAEAVALGESGIVRSPAGTTVRLLLSNRSNRRLEVVGAGLVGFDVGAQDRAALPLVLTPGAGGVLSLRVEVADCLLAGPAVAVARASGTPDLLTLVLSGPARTRLRVPVTTVVDVPGLLAYLEQLQQAGCP